MKNFPKKKVFFTFLALFVFLLMTGCTTKFKPRQQDGPPRNIPKNLLKTPNAVPKVEPIGRRGNFFGKHKSNVYTVKNRRYRVMKTSKGYHAIGLASWYGTKFHGRKTSNGEHYNMFAMTAAHRTLPLPSYIKVTNVHNRKSVIVKVTDRGPFHGNRLIDLSYVAAAKLGMLGKGTAQVEIISIDPRDNRHTKKPKTLLSKKGKSKDLRQTYPSSKKIRANKNVVKKAPVLRASATHTKSAFKKTVSKKPSSQSKPLSKLSK